MNRIDPQTQRLCGFWLILTILAGFLAFRSHTAPSEELFRNPDAPRGRIRNTVSVNTDPWASLARLPRIGEIRAKDIIRFREQAVHNHPGQIVFDRLEDLDSIRGIGPAALLDIEPYISFDIPAVNPENP